MKTFKLKFRNEQVIVPASAQDNTLIHIYDFNRISFLSVTSLNTKSYINSIWFDSIKLNIGERIDLEIVETSDISPPKSVNTIKKIRIKSKLEMFIELENDLKQKGIL
ncbi:hypothetical protein ACR777_20945 [Sphingobacterium spiritivorum]|uniref:hypothetical protein n=1 Tax=Sphingobacterium spiritivorum TaxID=258 RepID=UPI003DA1ECD1